MNPRARYSLGWTVLAGVMAVAFFGVHGIPERGRDHGGERLRRLESREAPTPACL